MKKKKIAVTFDRWKTEFFEDAFKKFGYDKDTTKSGVLIRDPYNSDDDTILWTVEIEETKVYKLAEVIRRANHRAAVHRSLN